YAAIPCRPGPYHISSILFHAAAAVALVFFAEELLLAFGIEQCKRRWIAFSATVVWAIHPVQSGAVVYVSGRADPLAAAFGFLGCYMILRSLRAAAGRGLVCLLGGGVALVLSVLSKETGLIFPALAILL